MPYADPANHRKWARQFARTPAQCAARRIWRAANLEEVKAARRRYKVKFGRRDWLWHTYRISLPDYDKLLADQEGHCALCDRTPDQERHGVLCVDHCHETDRIRGLLCDKHNRYLGGDTEASLLRALEYIRRGAARNSNHPRCFQDGAVRGPNPGVG